MGQVVSFVSGKGGVGKTTCALNVTQALSHFGRNVVLVEGGLRTSHLGLLLGFPSVEKTMHHVLEKKHDIEDAAYQHYSGIRVVVGNVYGSHQLAPDHFTALEHSLTSFKEKVSLVIVDTPPNHARETYHIMKASDFVVLVTTPDLAAVTETLKTKRVAEHCGTSILGILITKRGEHGHELSAERVARFLGAPVLGEIPYDSTVATSVSMKHPVVYSHPESPSAESFKALAAHLVGEHYAPHVPVEEASTDDLFHKLVERLA